MDGRVQEGMEGLKDNPQGSGLNAVIVVPCPLTGKTREEQVWESGVPVEILRCLGPGQRKVGAAGTPAFMVLGRRVAGGDRAGAWEEAKGRVWGSERRFSGEWPPALRRLNSLIRAHCI